MSETPELRWEERMTDVTFTESDTNFEYESLGPEYFASRRLAEARRMRQFNG